MAPLEVPVVLTQVLTVAAVVGGVTVTWVADSTAVVHVVGTPVIELMKQD